MSASRQQERQGDIWDQAVRGTVGLLSGTGRSRRHGDALGEILRTRVRLGKRRKRAWGSELEVKITGRHAAQVLLTNRETVAGIFQVREIDAAQHPVDVSRATLSLIHRDLLLERAGEPWPTLDVKPPLSLEAPIPFGWDRYGQPMELRMAGRHVGLFGETGSGKSVAQSMIVATAALSDARIFLMDANEIQLARWRPVAEEFVVDDMDEATRILDYLLSEIARRNTLTTEAGLDKFDRKVIGEPSMLLVIDEAADFVRVKGFTESLTRLCARSRAAGLHVVFTTQSPNATIVPTPLRNNLGLRAVFRVADKSASGVALGTSVVDASAIDPAHRGVCYLHQDGLLPVRMRTFYPDPDQVRELCARAVAYRKEET